MYSLEIFVLLLVCVSLSMETSYIKKSKPTRTKYGPPPANPWVKFGQKSYQKGTHTAKYAEAALACSVVGAKLARPTNEEENLFLFNLINSCIAFPEAKAWLGVNDVVTEGVYVDTASHDEICYKNWKKGVPDNLANEDCVEMSLDTGKWNDISCKYRTRIYVCERSN